MSETEAQAAEVETPDPPAEEPEAETAAAENTPDAVAEAVDPRIQKANKEAQRYRQELRTAQEALKAAERAQMSENDRVKAELEETKALAAELERVARSNSISAHALRVGAKYGAVNPEDVIALAGNQVTFDDAGQPENLDEVFERAKQDRPYLFTPAKTSTQSAGAVPGAGAPTMPAQKEETTREKRARLNGANPAANVFYYDTARKVAERTGDALITYQGKDITRQYSQEETRKFLESQRKSTAD